MRGGYEREEMRGEEREEMRGEEREREGERENKGSELEGIFILDQMQEIYLIMVKEILT